MSLIETREVKFYSSVDDFPQVGNELCVADGQVHVISGGKSNGNRVYPTVNDLPPASEFVGVAQVGSDTYTSDSINWYDDAGNIVIPQTPVGITKTTANSQITAFNLSGIDVALAYSNGLPRFDTVDVHATGKFVYVDPTGSDANTYAQAQVAATPWQTTKEVYDTAVSGDAAVLAAGIYAADGTGGYGADTWHRLAKSDKSLAYFGNGAELTATGTTQTARVEGCPNGGFVYLNGLVIDADGKSNGLANNDMGSSVWDVQYTDITIKNVTATAMTLTGLKSGTFLYDRLVVSGSGNRGITGSPGTLASVAALNVEIKNSVINLQRSGAITGIEQSATGAIANAVDYKITSCEIIAETLSTGTVIGILKRVNGLVSENNITVISNDTSSAWGILFGSSASHTLTAAKANDNSIAFNCRAGYGIVMGDIGGVITTGESLRNTVVGQYYSDATPHGMSLEYASVITAKYNKISQLYVGILASKTATGTDVSENLTIDCYGSDLYAKGCTAATFNKNTCVITGKYQRRNLGVISVDSQTGVDTVATTMSNNIVLVGTDDMSLVGALANITIDQTCTYSNNIYFVPDTVPDTTDLFYVGGAEGGRIGATAHSIDEWRAATSISNGTGTVTVTNERVIKLPLAQIQQMIRNLGVQV